MVTLTSGHAPATWSISRFLYRRTPRQRTERSSYRCFGLPIPWPGSSADRAFLLRNIADEEYRVYKCLHTRVQWFWHFFRNSTCFMCFWFGLEILRLVYKKVFFEIWNGFYLIWAFILRESSTTLYRSWKKFLQNWACRVSKEAEFCSDFKNVQKSRVWQKGKNLLLKNWIPLLLIPWTPISKEKKFQLL